MVRMIAMMRRVKNEEARRRLIDLKVTSLWMKMKESGRR